MSFFKNLVTKQLSFLLSVFAFLYFFIKPVFYIQVSQLVVRLSEVFQTLILEKKYIKMFVVIVE